MHSRAARGERQKSFGTDGVAGMFLTLWAGEISLTALWRKGVTGLDMTSEISFYLAMYIKTISVGLGGSALQIFL